MKTVSDSDRLTNLESNYSRLADGVHRVADACEKQGKEVAKAVVIIVGHLDPSTNEYVDGILQQTKTISEKQTACLVKQSNRWKKFGLLFGEVAVIVAAAFLIAHFGLN